MQIRAHLGNAYLLGGRRGRHRRYLNIDPVDSILTTSPVSLWVGSRGVVSGLGVVRWDSATGIGKLTPIHGVVTLNASDAVFNGAPSLGFAASGMLLDIVRTDSSFTLLSVCRFPNGGQNSYSSLSTIGVANLFAAINDSLHAVPSNEYQLATNTSNARTATLLSQPPSLPGPGLPTYRVNGVPGGLPQRFVTSFTRGLGIPLTGTTYLTGAVALVGYWDHVLTAADLATVQAAVLDITGATV